VSLRVISFMMSMKNSNSYDEILWYGNDSGWELGIVDRTVKRMGIKRG